MHLKSFQIFKYRNIKDSGIVDIDQITVIVGKNQSGKTALLRALHKLNPFDKKDIYDITNEWPRGERRLRNTDQVVCKALFKLDKQEIDELSQLASTEYNGDKVEISKAYSGNIEIIFPEYENFFSDKLHPNDIDEICKLLKYPNDTCTENFKKTAIESIEELKIMVKAGQFTEITKVVSTQIQKLKSIQAKPNIQQHNIENQFINSYDSQTKAIIDKISKEPSIKMQVHDYIVKNMPIFIYMDDYREFNGTANLDDLFNHFTKKTLTEQDKTILILMELSGLDIESLIKSGKSSDISLVRQRQLDLEDAGFSLTKDISGRWNQQEYSIHFVADADKFFVEITADNNVGRIPLEQQSKGFQWFFSFDLRFMYESKGLYKNCILLLDEPGLHLHPGGQKDLLKRLEAYSIENQLIYTTHLPFLLDLREPSRIRIINQTDSGAIINDDFGLSNVDEKLTLQSAFGMTLQQSYLIAQKNLIVEGVDDFIIITELSNILQRSECEYLDEEIQITAAGGASELVYMATLMIGQELEVYALFDSDKEGKIQEEKLRTKWLTHYKKSKSKSILLSDAINNNNQNEFAIEDIFSKDFYLKHVYETYKIQNLTLSGHGLLCNQVTEALSALNIKYNKGSVAKRIKNTLIKMNTLDDLSKETIDYAKALFKNINQFFK